MRFLFPIAALLVGFSRASFAQASASAAMDQAAVDRLFDEAARASAGGDDRLAAEKLEALLAGSGKRDPVRAEQACFTLGIAYLNDHKPAEAGKAFTRCLEEHPDGEYAGRCRLGIGRARMAAGTDESRRQAIDPLKQAMSDPVCHYQAGLALCRVYGELHMTREAAGILHGLMDSDVRSPDEMLVVADLIELMEDLGMTAELVSFMDRIKRQPGGRDYLAWYVNLLYVGGYEAMRDGLHERALLMYRAIPSRREILEIQRTSLARMRAEAGESADGMKVDIKGAERALEWLEGQGDFDGQVLMRRGTCLLRLGRHEEARVCFQTIRTRYPRWEGAEAAALGELKALDKLGRVADIEALASGYAAEFPDIGQAESLLGLRGRIQFNGRDWPEACESYKELLRLFPQSRRLEEYLYREAASLMGDDQFASAGLEARLRGESVPLQLGRDTGPRYIIGPELVTHRPGPLADATPALNRYLGYFPEGKHAGEVRYLLEYIRYEEGGKGAADEVLENLHRHLRTCEGDPAAGAMYALMGDIRARKQNDGDAKDSALSYYVKAIHVEKPVREVTQYSVEAANDILRRSRNWEEMIKINEDAMRSFPGTSLATECANEIARVRVWQQSR